MPIEDFLVDFYSKNADQDIDQVKIDSIVDYYGGDNVSMINDLYEKYDPGNINDDKVLQIQEYYSLDLPEQKQVIKESITQEEVVVDKDNTIKDSSVIKDISLSEPTKEEIKIDTTKKRFDKGLFKMAERPAYDNYIKTKSLDVSLLPKEKEEEVGFIQDKIARLGRGIASTAKGFEQFKTSLVLTGADIALDVFNPEITTEQKIQSLKVLKGVEDASLGVETYDAIIKGLGNYVREYDSESITDDIANGNYAQAADRAIGGVFESAPSLALAYLGPGGLIALGTSSAGNKFDEEFEENPEEGTKTILLNSILAGTAEASFELVTRGILSKARLLKNSGNNKAAKDLISNYSTNVIKRLATDPAAEGLSEAATEFTTDLIDIATFEKDELPDLFTEKNIKKWADAGIIGTLTGGGIVTTGALKSSEQSVRTAAEYTLTPNSDKKIINDAALEINNLNEQIKEVNNQEDVDIIEAQIANEENKIINTKKKVSEELNMMNPDELKAYADNIDKINKEKKRAQSNSIFVRKANVQNLANLELENQALIRESVDRRLNENIKTVGVKDLGRTVNDYNAKEDYQKAYDNTEFGKKNSMNVTSSDGFIDTEGDIYINKEVAQKVRNVNVPAHELLHGILDNNIKEPGQLKRLVNEFKAILPIETANLIQKRIDDNYRFTTDERGNRVERPESEYMQEYFTAFADLIGNRKVKFNENIFTKVGEKIIPIFKGKGYGHIKFETGKDVYDFIKSYQKQISKGELAPETIEAAKKVADQDVKTEFSKSEVTDLAKQYKADPANTDVEELIKQYDNVALKALGYDISKGTIAPEEAISFVNKEFDSILRRYDGSTEFSTWINSNIRPKRQAFYDEQIGKESETTSIDSEQARQVVDDSETTTDDRTEKEIRQAERKIKVAKRLNLEEKAIKEVSDKVKDVDLSKVNYKTLKNLANETIGEAFGISPNKILSNANLTKSEIANAQRYIKNNVDLLKALLPDGYNKDFKSTGVPKVLLDKFYNKRSVRAKTGAGLNVQIKKPNIGSNEFLEVFGFVDGKPTRDDRNISARIIALANQTGKAITNQTVREQLQKEGMPESALQDIKSGTPTAMFSLSTKPIQNQLNELALLRDKKAIAKVLGFKSEAINESTRPKLQALMQEAAKYLDMSIVAAGMMGSGGRQTFYGDFKDGKFVRDPKASKKWIKRTNGEYILFEQKKDGKFTRVNKKQVAEFDDYVAKPGRLYYSTKDPAYKKLVENVEKSPFEGTFKQIKLPKDGKITKSFLDNKKKQSDLNMEILDHVVNKLAQAVQDGMSMDVAGMIIIQSYQATSGLIKTAAPFKYMSDVFEYGDKKDGTKKYREEHNPPASVIGANLLWAIKNNAAKPIMKEVRKNFHQTVLSKKDDSKLDIDYAATLPNGTNITTDPIIRMAMAGINLNTIKNVVTGKSIIEEFGLGIDNKFSSMQNVSAFQNNLVEQVILEDLDIKEAKKQLDQYLKIAPSQLKASKSTNKTLNDSKVLNVEGNLNIQDLLSKAASIDEALNIARDVNAPVKKIRVFDFDDTLATTKSDVLFTAPDGTEGKLNAEEFAKRGKELLDEGYVFDFSEFNKVTKGKPGPLLEVAKKIQAARGTEDVFVLTARAPEAQVAIKEFLDGVGLNIPLENITGLGNSTGEAKANWMVDKAAEGYNDFYFADDAYQNVKAVKDVMSVIDVKSKVQQAKFSLSKDLNSDFNKILENKSGIGAEKVYSDARAKTVGASKGKFKFFIPPSAEDFVGLLYPTLAKGKLGDDQMAWYKERLLNPFARAYENLSRDRVNLMNDFKALKKELEVPKDLRKEAIDGFTNEQAVRVYLWNKQGLEIPGISKRDLKDLTEVIDKNPKLKVFADQLQAINKSDGYPVPQESWLVGTITTDLINGLNTVKRAKYLEEWQTNADIIFSKENLNKMEAIYGPKYREALQNVLSRMKTGKNRLFSESRIGNQVLDYINGSIGAIMFFNTRSAVLQTISSINFINWSDNNIYKAGKAFANQPQYWKDFTKLMNSDFLKDRRQGLKLNISESEIADAAATSKNKAKAALNYLLQKGFLPTQIADSFAIASGGATYYRNRINVSLKEGMSQKEAEEKAFRDFREIAEESQQSSRPDRISQQQASNVGRVILAFANTPSQYARIIKKAASDLKNKRGDWKNNVSKIIYYGAMQNLVFNVLQQALFAVGFGDDDEETEKREKKYVGIANGMVDSLLRGLGYGGAAVSVAKNLLLDVYERSKRKRPEYVDSAWKLLDFSPPIDSKVSKLKAAGYMVDKYGDDMVEKGFAIDNPAYEAGSKVVSATTNIPLDRLFTKANNIAGAMGEDAETWQRVAMMLGWPEWQIKDKKKIVKAPKTKEEKIKIKEERSKTRVKEAKGSTDYKTLKKLNRSEQIQMLKDLGYPRMRIKKLKKESDLIEEIIEMNKK